MNAVPQLGQSQGLKVTRLHWPHPKLCSFSSNTLASRLKQHIHGKCVCVLQEELKASVKVDRGEKDGPEMDELQRTDRWQVRAAHKGVLKTKSYHLTVCFWKGIVTESKAFVLLKWPKLSSYIKLKGLDQQLVNWFACHSAENASKVTFFMWRGQNITPGSIRLEFNVLHTELSDLAHLHKDHNESKHI